MSQISPEPFISYVLIVSFSDRFQENWLTTGSNFSREKVTQEVEKFIYN